MFMKHKYKIITWFVFFFLFGAYLPWNNSNGVHAFLISPPHQEVELTPGETFEGRIKVSFTKEDADTLYLSIKKLEVEKETGTKRIGVVDPEENGIINWLELETPEIQKPKNLTYKNGDNIVPVGYTINVPENAPPGGNYAVIVVSQTNPSDAESGTFGLSFGLELTHQILGTVVGEKDYNTELIEFSTKNNQRLFPYIPVDFITSFKNNGNIHVIPKGHIEIFNYSGEKIETITINEQLLRVFPQNSRTYLNTWGIRPAEEETTKKTFTENVMHEIKNFQIGKYTAEIQGYAGNQPPFKSSVQFWVIPWHLLSIFGTILLTIILLIVLKILIKRR